MVLKFLAVPRCKSIFTNWRTQQKIIIIIAIIIQQKIATLNEAASAKGANVKCALWWLRKVYDDNIFSFLAFRCFFWLLYLSAADAGKICLHCEFVHFTRTTFLIFNENEIFINICSLRWKLLSYGKSTECVSQILIFKQIVVFSIRQMRPFVFLFILEQMAKTRYTQTDWQHFIVDRKLDLGLRFTLITWSVIDYNIGKFLCNQNREASDWRCARCSAAHSAASDLWSDSLGSKLTNGCNVRAREQTLGHFTWQHLKGITMHFDQGRILHWIFNKSVCIEKVVTH